MHYFYTHYLSNSCFAPNLFSLIFALLSCSMYQLSPLHLHCTGHFKIRRNTKDDFCKHLKIILTLSVKMETLEDVSWSRIQSANETDSPNTVIAEWPNPTLDDDRPLSAQASISSSTSGPPTVPQEPLQRRHHLLLFDHAAHYIESFPNATTDVARYRTLFRRYMENHRRGITLEPNF